MLLRGVARRRPCGLSLRQFCAAVDVSSAQRPEEVTAGASSDVIRHVSVRESNRSRTRARVEGQLRGFLRSCESVMTSFLFHPPSVIRRGMVRRGGPTSRGLLAPPIMWEWHATGNHGNKDGAYPLNVGGVSETRFPSVFVSYYILCISFKISLSPSPRETACCHVQHSTPGLPAEWTQI